MVKRWLPPSAVTNKTGCTRCEQIAAGNKSCLDSALVLFWLEKYVQCSQILCGDYENASGSTDGNAWAQWWLLLSFILMIWQRLAGSRWQLCGVLHFSYSGSRGIAEALGKGCSRLEIKMRKSNAKRLLFDVITQQSPKVQISTLWPQSWMNLGWFHPTHSWLISLCNLPRLNYWCSLCLWWANLWHIDNRRRQWNPMGNAFLKKKWFHLTCNRHLYPLLVLLTKWLAKKCLITKDFLICHLSVSLWIKSRSRELRCY